MAAIADWEYIHVGVDGDDAKIGGLKVWKQKWRQIGEDAVMLPHPSYYHQIHDYRIYEIGDISNPVRFAACELSANVWGFYIPRRRGLRS